MTWVKDTICGLVKILTDGVVMTFVVVVTHLANVGVFGRSVYGFFDFDASASVFAGLRETAFEGVDDGWFVSDRFLNDFYFRRREFGLTANSGRLSLVTAVVTTREFDVELSTFYLLSVTVFWLVVAVSGEFCLWEEGRRCWGVMDAVFSDGSSSELFLVMTMRAFTLFDNCRGDGKLFVLEALSAWWKGDGSSMRFVTFPSDARGMRR